MNELDSTHSDVDRPTPSFGRVSRHFEPRVRASDSNAFRNRVSAILVCGSLSAVALAAGVAMDRVYGVPNVLLASLPVVLFAAIRYGFWAASLTSLLSIAAIGYFTQPHYTFVISESGNLWALAIFVIVSAYASILAGKMRQRADAVDMHSRTIEELYAFSSKLAALSVTDDLAFEATQQIRSMLGTNAVLMLPEHGALRVRANTSAMTLDPGERLAASWCWERGQAAGYSTRVFSGASHLFVPLITSRGTVGVVGVQRKGAKPVLSPDESRLLDALCDQVVVSLDRALLAAEMHEAAMLTETEKLRTALLTSISHDLKTPLASILGNVSSLRQYGPLYDDATRSEMLRFTEDETLRLSRFVENLLQMTRIDAGALRPNVENLDLSDLIGSTLQRTGQHTENHTVRTQLPPDLPMVPLDFVLTEHVLVNLIENAAKYSPQGSLITISVTEESSRVLITITDEGPGIPENDLERIFERFFRAQAGDYRRAGVGLGLSICKGFVEAMGGEIAARNRRDRSGAVFTVALPKPCASEDAA